MVRQKIHRKQSTSWTTSRAVCAPETAQSDLLQEMGCVGAARGCCLPTQSRRCRRMAAVGNRQSWLEASCGTRTGQSACREPWCWSWVPMAEIELAFEAAYVHELAECTELPL